MKILTMLFAIMPLLIISSLFQSCSDASSLDANILKSKLKNDTIIKIDTVYINDSTAIIIELLRKKNDSLITIIDSLKIPKKTTPAFTLINFSSQFNQTFIVTDSMTYYRTDPWIYVLQGKSISLQIDTNSNYPKFSYSANLIYENKQGNPNGIDYFESINIKLDSVSILDNRQLNKAEIQLSYFFDRVLVTSNSFNTVTKVYCNNYIIRNDRIYGFDINIEITCNNNKFSNQIPIKELKFNGLINVKY